MADIAQLGFSVDSSELKDAVNTLEGVVPAAANVDKAVQSNSSTFDKAAISAANVSAAERGLSSQSDALTAAIQRQINSIDGLVAQFGNIRTTSTRTTAAVNDNAVAFNMHTRALGNNRMQQMELMHIGKSLADQLAAGANPIRALSLEMGRIVEVVSITQGGVMGLLAQFGILRKVTADNTAATAALTAAENAENAALDRRIAAYRAGGAFVDADTIKKREAAIASEQLAAANGEVAASAETVGAAESFALAPLGVAILAIIAVVAAFGAAFMLADHNINQATGNIAKGLHLTSDQMQKLKDDGVKTSVTLGDTWAGFWKTVEDEFKSHAGGLIKWLQGAWNATLTFITNIAVGSLKAVLGVGAGTVAAIGAIWKDIPGIIGDAFISGVNIAVSGINWLDQRITDFVNSLGGRMKAMTINPLANPFGGDMSKGVSDGASAFTKAFNDAGKAVDDFGNKWTANSKKIAQDRILDAAGKAKKTPKGPKTDAEKFAEIVTGANNDINSENAKAAAAGIDMTAEAAAKYAEKQKLLNEANTKGIKLTDEMRSKIDQLAGAYAKAKVAADNAIGLKDVMKEGDKDIAAIDGQISKIGLYGRALAFATEQEKLLAEAHSKNMTPEAIAAAMPDINAKANKFADASANEETLKFMEAQNQAYMKNTQALDMQNAEIGMSADEVTRYEAEQKALNDAIDQHITLTAQDIAILKQNGDALANQQIAIKKTQEAIADATEETKTFVSTLQSDLEKGKSIWKSFGDAFNQVISMMIQKLEDKAITNWVDAMFKSSGGTSTTDTGSGSGSFFNLALTDILGSAKGNIFGFASGGIFANSIVDRPTMFAFGGNNLGIMGEAGPEAVVPLTRGSDGTLGVSMYQAAQASGGGQTVVAPNITQHNQTILQGAMTSDDVYRAVAAGSQNSIQQVKLSLTEWLNLLKADGVLV